MQNRSQGQRLQGSECPAEAKAGQNESTGSKASKAGSRMKETPEVEEHE
jgi:hypothetical protein